jgi:hypothetical protein
MNYIIMNLAKLTGDIHSRTTNKAVEDVQQQISASNTNEQQLQLQGSS